jgi:hypothetical protein
MMYETYINYLILVNSSISEVQWLNAASSSNVEELTNLTDQGILIPLSNLSEF